MSTNATVKITTSMLKSLVEENMSQLSGLMDVLLSTTDNDKIAELQNKIAELQNKIADLQNKLTTANDTITNLLIKVASANNKIADLQSKASTNITTTTNLTAATSPTPSPTITNPTTATNPTITNLSQLSPQERKRKCIGLFIRLDDLLKTFDANNQCIIDLITELGAEVCSGVSGLSQELFTVAELISENHLLTKRSPNTDAWNNWVKLVKTQLASALFWGIIIRGTFIGKLFGNLKGLERDTFLTEVYKSVNTDFEFTFTEIRRTCEPPTVAAYESRAFETMQTDNWVYYSKPQLQDAEKA